jgi:DNA-binding NtrC family response regulator
MTPNDESPLRRVCRQAEIKEIARALVEHNHNRTHTAVYLGISRRSLLNKIRLYGLTRLLCRELAGDVLPCSPERERVAS